MGALTIQLLILVSSFLFYRILRSGFDSWTSILIDFGIVLFLFGLQYFIQSQQEKNGDTILGFPSSQISSFFGASFPAKIAKYNETLTNHSSVSPRPIVSPTYFGLSENVFLDPKERKTLVMYDRIKNKDNQNYLLVPEDGFYLLQISCLTDVVPFSAKISLNGLKNALDKILHHGENSFLIYMKGKDQIQLSIENQNQKVMLLEDTDISFVKL
jgi:hypothetical protein